MAVNISVVEIQDWQNLKSDLLRERARRSAGGWAHFFIAHVGSEEAGILVLDILDRPPRASIHEIFVLSEYRLRGVGGTLLMHAVDVAKFKLLPTLDLEVFPLDTATSREFLTQWYFRSGFDAEQGCARRMVRTL
ncbi:GNAT family N-acetyltransferase [Paraburkholderia sp. Ac-20347]|uniref:GNAT family N-acetyltransferase n=1 Tax=Paraburkholderia sp. Ac-20347 TaxID=2703892 RepID=UPI0019806AF8|nr:GNAT family N-acetyltransferase [Paraburkholderia sp. Ac-20347]MBN3813425.1 GNAT family N-acetyltransferase [Paraburkholderia sp. Ac-20347]